MGGVEENKHRAARATAQTNYLEPNQFQDVGTLHKIDYKSVY